MTRVNRIESIDLLLKLWPRLLVAAQKDDAQVTPGNLLQLYLACLDYGAVFVVYDDCGLVGSCCVQRVNDSDLVLQSILRDHGAGHARAAIAEVTDWAREQGFTDIFVNSQKLAGSVFKYFEKSLGFKRHSVTFVMDLTQQKQLTSTSSYGRRHHN